MSDVTVKDLSVAYEGALAVDALDLEVPEGEWLSLIGPNGAGKTSVLRAIANLVPFRGDVRVGGHAVASLGRRELARRVSMLVQEPDMPAGMTVAHYVLLGAALTSATSGARATRTGGSSPRPCSAWGSSRLPRGPLITSAGAKGSASPSPGRSPRSRRFSSSTSRPHRSTWGGSSRCSS